MSFNSFLRKKFNIQSQPLVNKGGCAFCGVDVFVAEGQILLFLKDKPTHKKCRIAQRDKKW